MHRFYNEQYQIDGGRMDRYSTGSDAAGLTQGFYDTRQLPIYQYLTGKHAPRSVVLDRFFQSAFGGSYLNHQWLVAARTPVYPNAVADGSTADLHSVVGADGFPASTPLHPTTGLKDAALTQAANPDGSCLVRPGQPTPPAGTVCGDWSVNTIQPAFQPFAPGTPEASRLPAQTYANIGTRLSAAGVSWAWYSGGWDNADGNVNGRGWTNGNTPGTCTDPQHLATAVYPNCPDALFQFHHQPLNYFAEFAPGTAARARHLRDEQDFLHQVKTGTLPAVSFVKPVGEENEHPGYASVTAGPGAPGRPAQGHRGQPAGGLDRGRRDLRRVRRAVGPRAAADPGRRLRPVGSGHPDPGHRDLAAAARPEGQLAADRHDLDPGHDRGPVPPGSADQPGRLGQQPGPALRPALSRPAPPARAGRGLTGPGARG